MLKLQHPGAEHAAVCAAPQEVDLVAELAQHGMTREAAEQLLDAGLAMGLSVWVGSRPCR